VINNKKKKRGFTLIEVMLTMVIIATGLFGLMVIYHNSARNVMDADINLMASYLARERLEKLVSDKVAYGYDYVINENYSTTANVTVGGHQFTRSFNIYEVLKDDLFTPQVDSGFKRIDMTVSWGLGADENVILSTILTDY